MTEKRYKMVNTNLVDDDGLVYYLIKKDGRDVCQVFGKHTAKAIVTELNSLHEENQELRQDNDIKFWKHQFMIQHNSTQLILHELSLAMNEGYEVSDKFKEWLDDLTEKNKEVITKHERLFE